jgi:hypothetical protein
MGWSNPQRQDNAVSVGILLRRLLRRLAIA